MDTLPNFSEDIEALFDHYCSQQEQFKVKVGQSKSIQNISIPEDFCTAELNQKFDQTCSKLSLVEEPLQTIEALDYLSDCVLRDHHRFLPYLERYADQLLAGCARQLEHFLAVEYPKILADPDGEVGMNIYWFGLL